MLYYKYKKKMFCDIENTTNNIIEDTNDHILMEIPFVKNLNINYT